MIGKRFPVIAIVPLLLFMLTSAYSAAMTLNDYKNIYDKQIVAIEKSHSKNLEVIGEKYNKYLKDQLSMCQNKGDLEGYQKVKAETVRFVMEKNIPAESPFHQYLQKAESDKSKKIVILSQKYITGLDKLKVSLMRGNKIDDAQVVYAEIKRTELDIAQLKKSVPATAVTPTMIDADPQLATSKSTTTLPRGLLLYEPFDYPAGEINGKGGNQSGFEPKSVWSYSGTGTADIDTGSLTFSSFPTRGNKAHHFAKGKDLTELCRKIDISKTEGTLYMSFLLNGGTGKHIAHGLMIKDEKWKMGASFKPGAVNDARSRFLYGSKSSFSGQKRTPKTTYLYVLKYEGLGSSTGGKACMWILTDKEYASLVAGGVITDEVLSKYAGDSANITLKATAPTLDGSESLHLWYFDDYSVDFDSYWDEIRVGVTVASVVPSKSGTRTAPIRYSAPSPARSRR